MYTIAQIMRCVSAGVTLRAVNYLQVFLYYTGKALHNNCTAMCTLEPIHWLVAKYFDNQLICLSNCLREKVKNSDSSSLNLNIFWFLYSSTKGKYEWTKYKLVVDQNTFVVVMLGCAVIEKIIDTFFFILCYVLWTLSNLTSVHVTGLTCIELVALQDFLVIFKMLKLIAYVFAEVFIGRPWIPANSGLLIRGTGLVFVWSDMPPTFPTSLSLCFGVTHFTQVRGEEVPSLSSAADHQCYYRLPQWGLVHSPQDGLQRPAHLSCFPAQRDHLGGWRQCCRSENCKHTRWQDILDKLTSRKMKKTLFERLGVLF